MKKRIIALSLCLFVLVGILASCAGSIAPTSEYKGQQITMYLTETVYDLDPARAYKNESTRAVVGLLFDTLFVLDKDGKVSPSLAASYSIEENEEDGEYFMYITMANTNWSDNTPVTADDVVFAWKRLLNPNYSFEAAALLFDIMGAREYNENEGSKDDIKITADRKRLTIQFNGPIDYDQFLLNLTSLALAPLREDIVGGIKNEDWAKKPGTMICSGPFKLGRISFSTNSKVKYDDINYWKPLTDTNGKTIYVEGTEVRQEGSQVVNSFILERNSYYYRTNSKEQNLDASVAPYKIVVDCAMSDENIKEAYENGTIMYVGDIPMSLREEYKDEAITKDSLSTNTIYFNQNSEVNGELYSNPAVRQALSMVIDREAIADALVFAEAADGLVPTGVFDSSSAGKLFRDNATGEFKYLVKDEAAAKKLLQDAGIKASEHTITLTYADYDEVHTFIAKEIKKAWESLGFTVNLRARGTVANNDYYKLINGISTDICDDLYYEDLIDGSFEVIILDMVAISADPFSVLAPFAKSFSGQKMDMSDPQNYQMTPHVTGYDSEEYNELIEKIFDEKNISKRSADLHKAEEILMKDMPVIPVVYNKTAYLVNDDLKLNNTTLWWENGSNYYGACALRWCSVDNYDAYLKTCSDFLEKHFEEFQYNSLSYFAIESYKHLTFEEFKEESSNYSYLWKVYETESNLKK